ncbi:MAG: hypothetical protein J7M38_16040 [Armatimonadetes bacterium]|nr:hypothetical protein [Armatimonadota bacterium]
MSTEPRLDDGLSKPRIIIQARQLLGTVCRAGGVDCPLISAEEAASIREQTLADPTVTIQLMSDAEEIPHFRELPDDIYATRDPETVRNRKRDLDVLQRLGLVPGSIRRARYLYEWLFRRIETPWGICAWDTPGWEGCGHARSGAYERMREEGWTAFVYDRPVEERAEWRARSEEEIATGDCIYIRPHHLMCLACGWAGGENDEPRPNDTLWEILQRIRKDPDIPVVLVEGPCSACDCCDGFHPATGRCTHAGGLIRDYKKDLDCFQRLGLMPGDSLPAREMYALLFERIPSTQLICGYGNDEVTASEWTICGGPGGNAGYVKTRERGIF